MNDLDQDPADSDVDSDATENLHDGSDTEQQPVERKVIRRKPSPTPFDHPLSFPILIGAFTLWFGYDGWFNPKTHSVGFNQVMFGICLVIFLLTIRIGLREMRIVRERKQKKAEEELFRAEG